MRNFIRIGFMAIAALATMSACKSSTKKASATQSPTSSTIPSTTLGQVPGYTVSISGMEGGTSGFPTDVSLSSSALAQLYIYVTPTGGAQPATSVTLSDTTFSVTGTASPFQLINAGLGSRLALGQAIPLNVTAIGGSVQTVAYFNLKSDTALNNTNNLNNTNTNNLNNNTTNNTNPQEGILSRLWNGATSLVSGGVSGIWTWITGLFQN